MKNGTPAVPARDFYEGEYARDFEEQPVERLERLLPMLDLEAGDEVVDFGCGNGMLADLVADRVARYTGVDFSRAFVDAAVRRARSRGIRNARFVSGDIVRFCSRHPSAFDKAFTMDFSEHISDEQFVPIYSAIRSSLRGGGILYVHTPNGSYFIELLKRLGVMRQFPEHVGVRNAARNRELLAEAGFHDIAVRQIAHYNVMRYAHFVSYLPVIGRFGAARLFITCRKESNREPHGSAGVRGSRDRRR